MIYDFGSVLNVVAIGLLIACPAIGLVTRRRESVLLPLGGWPLFYAGLNRNWWLDGTGDGWQAAAVTLTCIGVASTIIAVAAGRASSRRLGERDRAEDSGARVEPGGDDVVG